MRRSRRNPPPPRTAEERAAARAARAAARARRRGQATPLPAPEPATAPPEPGLPAAPAGGARQFARNTAIFSLLTGLSRVAGLVREIVAAAYYGTAGAASAFTLAFQVPNLIRALVADAAL